MIVAEIANMSGFFSSMVCKMVSVGEFAPKKYVSHPSIFKEIGHHTNTNLMQFSADAGGEHSPTNSFGGKYEVQL
ncbi:MAG: hypothetical protein IPH82_19585 [Chloroflexi bacterium]|nr:hypothetical protein [Chloroflexota bacterium]